MNLTEEDYLFDKLAGKLDILFRDPNARYEEDRIWLRPNKNIRTVEDIQQAIKNVWIRESTAIEVRYETFEEWKARKEQE